MTIRARPRRDALAGLRARYPAHDFYVLVPGSRLIAYPHGKPVGARAVIADTAEEMAELLDEAARARPVAELLAELAAVVAAAAATHCESAEFTGTDVADPDAPRADVELEWGGRRWLLVFTPDERAR